MKKVKLVFWLLLLGFLALIVFQNQQLFLDPQVLSLNLYLTQELVTPELPNTIFFLAFFLFGLLLAYFFSLAQRFKLRKKIKQLKALHEAQAQELASLKTEVASMKSSAGPEEPLSEAAAAEPQTS